MMKSLNGPANWRARMTSASALLKSGVSMRPVCLGSSWFPREPNYVFEEETRRIEARLERARAGRFLAAETAVPRNVRWCTRCVYPSLSATPMDFDENGVCMGCHTQVTPSQAAVQILQGWRSMLD